jgi:hypothetical protein
MGMATAGLICRAAEDTRSDERRLFEITGKTFLPLGSRFPQLSPRFDPRNDDDFILATLGDIGFIFNGPMVEKIMFDGCYDNVPRLSAALHNPHDLLAFCWYDSGGSYGFAMFKDENIVRRILMTVDKVIAEGTPLQEEPADKAIEDRKSLLEKLAGQKRLEGPEQDEIGDAIATARNEIVAVVDAVIAANSGWSPWTMDDPADMIYRYYRAAMVPAHRVQNSGSRFS